MPVTTKPSREVSLKSPPPLASPGAKTLPDSKSLTFLFPWLRFRRKASTSPGTRLTRRWVSSSVNGLEIAAIEGEEFQKAASNNKIDIFENAFRKIKEATGVSDVNEVIKKIEGQEGTSANLMSLTKENQARVER